MTHCCYLILLIKFIYLQLLLFAKCCKVGTSVSNISKGKVRLAHNFPHLQTIQARAYFNSSQVQHFKAHLSVLLKWVLDSDK